MSLLITSVFENIPMRILYPIVNQLSSLSLPAISVTLTFLYRISSSYIIAPYNSTIAFIAVGLDAL